MAKSTGTAGGKKEKSSFKAGAPTAASNRRTELRAKIARIREARKGSYVPF